MPVQDLQAAAGVPVPFDLAPERVDPGAKAPLLRIVPIEVLSGAQEPRDQERGLDEVAAVVLPAERNRPAGIAVDKVRKDAVITLCLI
jgi:hypothetical protein